MAQRILGLDIGASAVRAVLISSTYRGFSVVASARVPLEDALPAERPLRERQGAAVRRLLENPGFAFDTALVALPGISASHVVTLPFTDVRRIDQTLPFEVEGLIPFDLAEVAFDWQPLRLRENQAELLVAVVQRKELKDLLADLGQAGIDARAVLPPGPAYAALFGAGVLSGEAASAEDLAQAELVLDQDQDRVSVCVVRRGACEAARTFAASAAGVPALLREVRTTLRAWRARSGPDLPDLRRVLLAGLAAQAPELREALLREVGVPVEPLALAGAAASRLPPEEGASFALALALALRGYQGSRAPRLNLRRGELAYTRDFEHLRGKLARLGAWAALIVLLAVVSSGVKVFALSRQEKLLDGALCSATRTLLGKCYTNDELAVAALRGKGSITAYVPKDSALDVFAELAARTPRDLPLKFERIEITRDKLHLQGVTDAAENVDKIVNGLKASRCFGDSRSGGVRKRSVDGKFEFTVDSDLTCETGEAPAERG
ncbi:MAG TPA: pilus assembly protein PilM [Anaeromyxobacteraceae bacterium]|nr:pilus assembly protein PilM [Anaeromyxobacteraceae bacterium]